jgi:retinol dehydrogenase 14
MTLAVNHLAPFLLTRLGWSLIHLRYHRLVVGAEHPWVSVGPDEGARTIIHVASSPEVEGVSGQYFSGCRPMPSSPESRDPEAARRLWAVSERLTALTTG